MFNSNRLENDAKVTDLTAAQVGVLPIPDAGGHFTDDTIDGALQALGLSKANIANQSSVYPTLKNGWESWTHLPYEVYINGSNEVCITGGITGGAYSNGTEIMTLDVGYHPTKPIYALVACADQLAEIRISTDGEMVCQGFPNNTWVSFDNIVPFRHA